MEGRARRAWRGRSLFIAWRSCNIEWARRTTSACSSLGDAIVPSHAKTSCLPHPLVASGPRRTSVQPLGIDSLLPGELGHRETFRRAVIEAIDTNASSLLFFEEDVVPRVDFSERWDILRASPRCFGFLHHPGGVLLLGASEWSLPWAKEELEQPLCYNTLHRTSGTFAIILSWHVLPLVLMWLGHSNRPSDHVYEYLTMKGYPVRVAHPYLFVHKSAAANGTSTINTHRVHTHRKDRGWGNLSQYAWTRET